MNTCKNVFGLLVCRFESGHAVIPPLNVDIWTTDHCPFCEPAIEMVNNVLSPLSDAVKINIHKDEALAFSKGIKRFPTVEIGDKLMTGIPEAEEIFSAVFKHATLI